MLSYIEYHALLRRGLLAGVISLRDGSLASGYCYPPYDNATASIPFFVSEWNYFSQLCFRTVGIGDLNVSDAVVELLHFVIRKVDFCSGGV